MDMTMKLQAKPSMRETINAVIQRNTMHKTSQSMDSIHPKIKNYFPKHNEYRSVLLH